MVHIDWLTVYEDHPQAPDWGETLRVDYNAETGDLEREVMLGSQVEESWQTFLRVRSHGGRVEVSGNPSKWGRLEAVVGIGTMHEAIEVYNAVLRELGLPRFSQGRTMKLQTTGNLVGVGPRISRVDLASNIVLGDSAAVRPFLDWLSTQRWGRKGSVFDVHSAGLYVKAGSKQRRELVFYDKAEELRKRAAQWRRKRCEEKEAANEYLERCSQWAQCIGLVRRELRLRSKELSETGLCYLGNFTNWGTEAKAELLKTGISKRQAAALMNWVLGWMGGADPRDGISKATFHRRRKIVLEALGVDLRGQPNVRTLGTRVRAMSSVIEARPLTREDLPDWYDWAQTRRAA